MTTIACPYCGFKNPHDFAPVDPMDTCPPAETIICGEDGEGCYEEFSALPDGRVFYWVPTAPLSPSRDMPAQFHAKGREVYIEYDGEHADQYFHLMAASRTPQQAQALARALNATLKRFEDGENAA